MRRIIVTPIKLLSIMLLGAFLAVLAGGIWLLENRPDLEVWHTADLDAEFTARSKITSFAEYLEIEDRVFRQVEELVYRQVDPDKRRLAMRYSRDGLADPRRWPRNWNRSFEMVADEPAAGVLLLHGMSDSPYSLRALGESLHRQGATVVGLRFPGHGTAPSGLRGLRDVDMMAATKIGARHVRELVGDRPVYVVGYSTGGALAVDYALTAIEDDTSPQFTGIVLISPSIGVTGAAQFAVWQARIGYVLGLPKLEWNSLTLEHDPFKYGAFAVNAGDVVYRLTRRINAGIDRAREDGTLDRLPPILAFQSIIDDTVSTPALIDGLMANLPTRGDELVVFDIDRGEGVAPLMAKDPADEIQTRMDTGNLPFSISFITNYFTGTDEVEVINQPEESADRTTTPLGKSWPPDVVSLAHVALPFPPTDELYGAFEPEEQGQLYLGNLSMRGERGLLLLSPAAQLRMRWNPFFDYLEERTLEFMQLE